MAAIARVHVLDEPDLYVLRGVTSATRYVIDTRESSGTPWYLRVPAGPGTISGRYDRIWNPLECLIAYPATGDGDEFLDPRESVARLAAWTIQVGAQHQFVTPELDPVRRAQSPYYWVMSSVTAHIEAGIDDADLATGALP
ncbi:hypothetical protein [Demequina sp. NBRC 110054]|uniref:hypothetical protein n=1 Tax=Demequina sp. NBRC 110054 TaxID=1570343 RepID=UPI000A00B646|nr:hypothetical protein [Demequina sp. NBRC 110054]